MPSVFVLYLEDQVVSPHLELLRNICEPTSKSRPHITVRYFDKLSVPEDYINARVKDIELLGIGSFGIDDASDQINRTVFIKCQSEELLRLEHKPLFPTSQFHITLYDGVSESFARSLRDMLRSYKWAVRVPLPKASPLVQIEIKPKRRKKTPTAQREYKDNLHALYKSITGNILDYSSLINLTDEQRLATAKKICLSLQRSIKNFERIKLKNERHLEVTNASDKEYQMHLTPPELAYDITRYALSLLNSNQRSKIEFGDPAVGTGAFFGALLAAAEPNSIHSAIGVDISPSHVAAARWRWKRRGMEVIEGDYLHMERLPPRNLILANPPYLRHQGIPQKYKQDLRLRASTDIGMRISGLSGQYLYFLLLSHKWMEKDAIAAWLIPSEFMQTTYGKALRFYLTQSVQLIRIHQFSAKDRQFENAETLPCVVVFKNAAPLPNHKAEFTLGGSLNEPHQRYTTEISNLSVSFKWTLNPQPARVRDNTFLKLGDLFDVRRGIATGSNDFFVMDLDDALKRGIPSQAIKPLLPKAKSLHTDIITATEDGYPNVDRKLCVIDCDMPIEEIRKNFPKMYDYLKEGENNGILNRYLVARRKPWYRQEQRDVAPFLCTYMGKAHGDKPAIRFLLNQSKAIVTNTYLMLYPKPGLQKLIHSRPETQIEVFNLLKAASHEAMSEFSRLHAGGLTKIEPRELLEVWLGPTSQHIQSIADRKLFD